MRRTCPKPTPSIITESLCGSSTCDVTGEECDHSTPSSAAYLTVMLDDESVYEWFELTDALIASITLEKLLLKIKKYFNVVDACLSDVDGAITNTVDLRRSLRTAWPTLRVSACRAAQDYDNTIFDSHASPIHRVTVRKRNHNDFFGFSNVPSRDGKSVIVTDIDPEGLIQRIKTNIQIGDTIVAVNGVINDAHAMRRELLVSTIIDVQFKRTSFILGV